jgi:hypothetical protein
MSDDWLDGATGGVLGLVVALTAGLATWWSP